MSTIKTSVPDDIRNASEEIFRQIGTDMQNAIRMFLAQVVQVNGLPFRPVIARQPNAVTMQAIEDSYAGRVETVEGGVAAMLAEMDD